MTLVVVFNGQGEQRREHVERLFREAAPDRGEPLHTSLREQGLRLDDITDEELLANRVAQPVICAYQLAVWRKLAPHLPIPALLAGYSLGELTAFSCAGAIAADETVPLAAFRARVMDEAVAVPSGLLAIFGLEEQALRALCQRHSAEIAIRNGRQSFIIGGSLDALMRVAEEAKEAGANRVTRLGVPTPSHTSLLADAARRFGAELRPKMQGRLDIPALSGVDGRVVRSGRAALTALEQQISHTIDWAACMETIVSFRPNAVLEIGPGTALSRMLRDLEPGLEVRAVDDFRLLSAAADWVRVQF
ncbi:MAG TPA: acyltransferase domain-containing protein [Burkholderiaceae bacterium]|nr:acyltransferase domain-containing protein [Burkholderiaceae bacterium]